MQGPLAHPEGGLTWKPHSHRQHGHHAADIDRPGCAVLVTSRRPPIRLRLGTFCRPFVLSKSCKDLQHLENCKLLQSCQPTITRVIRESALDVDSEIGQRKKRICHQVFFMFPQGLAKVWVSGAGRNCLVGV